MGGGVVGGVVCGGGVGRRSVKYDAVVTGGVVVRVELFEAGLDGVGGGVEGSVTKDGVGSGLDDAGGVVRCSRTQHRGGVAW